MLHCVRFYLYSWFICNFELGDATCTCMQIMTFTSFTSSSALLSAFSTPIDLCGVLVYENIQRMFQKVTKECKSDKKK